ncbi:MAG: sensor histidine kinase, partial [Limisphaerales bacterium]
STRQMGQMIEGILALSRLNRQKMDFQSIPTLNILEPIISEYRSRTPERQIDFKVGTLPDSWGDPALLRTLWSNLIDNAVKFTRPRSNPVVEVEGSAEGSETIFFIRDNGVGFDMKYQSKLFGLFQRFHTEKEFEGSGVGLAVARRLVRRHGGRIWAESEVDKGTTLYFSLPHSPN